MSENEIDWDNWRLFMAVARERGLAGAVKLTGKSAPTLGRRMQMLEQLTGKELFERLPRGYELTESGQEVFDRLAQIESTLSLLDGSEDDADRPLVKISAGSWMTYGLCQRIKMIMKGTGSVRVRFVAVEAVLNISRRETTIGIRNSRPTQENLICRKLGRVHFAGYASSHSENDWITVHQDTPSAVWIEAQMKDRVKNKKTSKFTDASLEVTSRRTALDIASSGTGRVVLPTFIGGKISKLQKVTPRITELTHDQWLVTHPDEQYRLSVRKVIDGVYGAAKDLHC